MIAVVGGAGHVGLPLSLALSESGNHVVVIDKNREALHDLEAGRVPFYEPGADSKLAKALTESKIQFSQDIAMVAKASVVIVVIGTPVGHHGFPESATFLQLVEELLHYMAPDSLLLLRSTVAPGTTERVDKLIAHEGKKIHLAYCPERIAEHQAFEELKTIPQLVAGASLHAQELASNLFAGLGSDIVPMQPLEAELGKLFANSWRYSKFAVANEFRMICDEHGVDYEQIRQAISHDYPRAADLPKSGLAAGPCLPKDTQQLISSVALTLPVLRGALTTNEDLAKYIRRIVVNLAPSSATVGILGMSFKPRSDDIRDSLAYRIKKEVSSRFDRVLCADPHVSANIDPTLVPFHQVVSEADLVIIGCPHPEFSNLSYRCPVIDIWGSVNWATSEN